MSDLSDQLNAVRTLVEHGGSTHVTLRVQELRELFERLRDAVQVVRDIHEAAQRIEDPSEAVERIIDLCDEVL